MPAAQLQPLLTGDRRFVSPEEGHRSEGLARGAGLARGPGQRSTVLQAIFSERRTIRDYPNGPLASNIIGFTNAEGHGAVGLESGMDTLLAGKPGSVTFEQAAGGPRSRRPTCSRSTRWPAAASN